MDDFRKLQKQECLDGTKNKKGIYGCRCCRKFSNLNTHKKYSRKLARVRLKEKTQHEIQKI